MLSEKTVKRRGPSILLLAVAIIACIYGAIFGWLALVDGRYAGKPVVELSLPPEVVPEQSEVADIPPTDTLLRPDITSDNNDATPGATPLPAGTPDQLSDDELALLRAAEDIRSGETSQDAPGEVKILGAEHVSGGHESNSSGPITLGKVPPLAAIPDPDLVEASSQGPLPKVSKDGRKPWQVYARPLPAGLGDSPRIALVVSGLGISESATAHAIKTLPPEVTLSFAPYGADLQKWITQARAAGHEVLLELPMEPFGYPQNDPGPYTLLTSLNPAENISRLEWLLSRFTGYTGVMNYQGARFTTAQGALSPVLSAIKSRGLMYVDNGTTNRSIVPDIANSIGLPLAVGSRNIDPVQSADIIDQSFSALELGAKSSGIAIGVASGFPVTVDAVSDWAETLAAKGIALVPVSAAAK
tara:strand:+ start:32234 stop:33478 length:1245 start_codon:yes stop_codon:yes gene_type:complete